MNQRTGLSMFSLRTKLVLSYLGVALGAIIILAIVMALIINQYFYNVQISQIRNQADGYAQQAEQAYQQGDNQWANVRFRSFPTSFLLIATDAKGTLLFCNPPFDLGQSICNDATIKQTMVQTLQGTEVDGTLPNSASNAIFPGLYVSIPLYANGQVIGAVFIASPQNYQHGLSPQDFLHDVYQTIFVIGIIVTVIVIAFSLLMARRLTHPLESLTAAAEHMAEGDYTQRVVPPRSQDELGRLAQTFNIMANTIESDVGELRHQEQMRRDLIANIAHDLATPLTAIQGFSEAMADEVIQDPTSRHETAQLIAREVQRLRRLVGDMQQMTSLELGRVKLELAPLDMQVLVAETLAVIEPECVQAGIMLRSEIEPGTPLVLADSDRITQVLLNLIDNARRHTPEGGSIIVGARPEGKQLMVWINDTGVGIDPVDLPNIFERFYRADRSRTGTTGGSGLGLSIVKAIILAHGGTIRAESTPGHGTRVLFTLPLVSNEPPVVAPPTGRHSGKSLTNARHPSLPLPGN